MEGQNVDVQGRLVRLDYDLADVDGKYATHMVVQHSDCEFTISFFEVRPPIILGPEQEVEAQLEETKSVSAKCVARVVVAQERMLSFIQALQLNYEKFAERKAEQHK